MKVKGIQIGGTLQWRVEVNRRLRFRSEKRFGSCNSSNQCPQQWLFWLLRRWSQCKNKEKNKERERNPVKAFGSIMKQGNANFSIL